MLILLLRLRTFCIDFLRKAAFGPLFFVGMDRQLALRLWEMEAPPYTMGAFESGQVRGTCHGMSLQHSVGSHGQRG